MANVLSHLRFTDDTVLLSNDIDEIREVIVEMEKESKKAGLEMNFEKTKMPGKMEIGTETEIGRGTITWT